MPNRGLWLQGLVLRVELMNSYLLSFFFALFYCNQIEDEGLLALGFFSFRHDEVTFVIDMMLMCCCCCGGLIIA